MWKTLLLLFLPFCGLFAQQEPIPVLSAQDTILLEINPFNEKYFLYEVKAGQTLFSIAKHFGLSVEEVKMYNPGLGNNMRPGQKIEITLPNRAIMRFEGESFDPFSHCPVFYKIKKGDTFYGLSNRLFKMPMDTIRARLVNNYDDQLHPGQKIFVGWMPLTPIPTDYRTTRGHPLLRKNHELRTHISRYKRAGKREYEEQGIAFWQESGEGDGHYFALHESAPVNSYIEVYNPMKNRYIYLRVIGRIPVTAYGSNVKVVLPAIAAKLLGAKDPRFFVKIKYYR